MSLKAYFKKLINNPSFDEAKATMLARQAHWEEERRRNGVVASYQLGPAGFYLGKEVTGSVKPFPTKSGVNLVGGKVSIEPYILQGHMAVFGTTQYGKTTFLLRLISEYLEHTDGDVVLLDGKGNTEFGDRFCGLAYRWHRGNPPRLFVGKNRVGYPFNGLTGSVDRVRNLLIELGRVGELTGNALTFGERHRIAIAAVVNAPCGPPRDFDDFLVRLSKDWIHKTYGKNTPFENDPVWKNKVSLLTNKVGFEPAPIDGLAIKYLATIDELGPVVKKDGFSLGEVRAANFCVDLANVPYTGRAFTEFVLSSILGYLGHMPRPMLLVVDEFGEAKSPTLEALLALGSQAGLQIVFTAQSHAQLGDQYEQERILNNCNTQVFFKLNIPEPAANFSGTVMRPETAFQAENGVHTGITSTRFQHQYAIDPNIVRALPKGNCFLYRDGGNVRIEVDELKVFPPAPAEDIYAPKIAPTQPQQPVVHHKP